jgi:hypothetical protein
MTVTPEAIDHEDANPSRARHNREVRVARGDTDVEAAGVNALGRSIDTAVANVRQS